jgi:hypothetical protein
MEESRGRFVESAEMVLRALEDGHCEQDGQFIRQPRTPVRPAPVPVVPRRTYAGRGVARVGAHHGEARRRAS